MTLKSKANLNKTTKGNLQKSKKMRTNKSKKNSFRSNKNKAKNQRRLSKSTKKYSKSNQRGGKLSFSSFFKNLYPSSNSPTPENDDFTKENSPTPENDDSRKEKLELILNDIKIINDSEIKPAFGDFDLEGEKGYWYKFPIPRENDTKSIWVLQKKTEPLIKEPESNSQGSDPHLKAEEEALLKKKFLSDKSTDQAFEKYLKGQFSNLEILLRKKVTLEFEDTDAQNINFATWNLDHPNWNVGPDGYHVSLPLNGWYSFGQKEFVNKEKKNLEIERISPSVVESKYPVISLFNPNIPVTKLEADLLKCYCHNEISKKRRYL